MNWHVESIELLEFDGFVLSTTPLRLTRNGAPVRLRTQALRLLALLASRPGELLRHEEIRELLWKGRVVDYSGGVHVCVRRIRAVLDDSAETPRFVETVPRLGYRFVSSVRRIGPGDRSRVAGVRSRLRAPMALAATLVFAALAALAWIATLPDHGSATWASDRARDAYLRGRYLVDQGSRDQVAKGVPFLRAALKADRGFLPAHLGLSEAHRILGEFGTARQHADLALEISPQSAEAHLNLATLLMEAEWNWDEAGSHLEEAIRLDPDSPKARQQAAVRLAIVGEMPRALAQMDVAMRLDPVSTLIRTDYGWLLYYAGRHAEAIASCQQALELEARLLGAHLCIERAATAMGDAAVAADAALQAMNLWRAAAEDIAGVAGAPVAEASRAFSEWRLRFYANYPDQSRISAEDMAEANAAVGRFDAALTHLERATEARSRYLPLLLADPLLAPLRGDARFDALLTEVRKGFLRA